MEILEIKGHFGEVKGYIDLKARVLATSLPFWNGRFWIFQSKISEIFLGTLFSHGSDILTHKFPKISPVLIWVNL